MAGVDSLLSSFPAPPSFIPPSPLPYDRDEDEDDGDYFAAQMGMGPPRMPLPAVPGGLNELDALMSIVQSPAPSRRESRASQASWRFSRLSDTSALIKTEHMAPLQPRSSISLPDETTPSPPTPTQASLFPKRSASPDINELLATTPRPLVRRLNSLAFTASTASSSSSLINPEDDFDSNSSESEQSDSSIDIATPLPNLMVKAGLLSPRSKTLAPAEEISHNVVPKDERDTHRRRNRHRNGRLLREGIGLTTGLGWSDSEDEDAPSALTRRLSTIDLSRRQSIVSLGNRSRSRSDYSHTARQTRSTSSFAKDRSPLSRSSSTASAATFGAMSVTTNSRGYNPSASENSRTSRKRNTSEGPSMRSGSSMSLGAYMSESDHVPEPMPALPELVPSRAGPVMPGGGLRKATSAYPLPRSMSIDSQMTSVDSVQSAPYAMRPLSPASLLSEKPLPQLPTLEDPPPRSDSRGAIRSRAKSNAPPSSFGRVPTPTRKRTISNSSATSISSIGSAGNTGVSPTPSASRPPLPIQTSAPLRRANGASVPRSSASGSSMPQLRKRPSELSLPQREHASLGVLAVNVSPLASPNTTAPSSAVSSLPTPVSVAPQVSPSAVTDLATKMLPPRSPSAPRALRLGTPGISRIVAPRTSVSGTNALAASTSALPTPRGRTTSVTRLQTPRTGAGMAYRNSGAPATRA